MNAFNYMPRTGTKYPSAVRTATENVRVLKPGSWNRKLGAMVAKGAWADMPIYSLTLEERATCPRTCLMWDACYGNNMPFAHRFQPGPELAARLEVELGALQLFHPRGFVIRLHVLGDFYSPDYVARWGGWLSRLPALHTYGYTAHLPGSPVGEALGALRNDRFVIRTSGVDTCTVEDWADRPAGAFRCPAQLKKSVSCANCTLCWSTDRLVAFKRH